MDDSPTRPTPESHTRMPLGMSSFGSGERQQFGQNIRLAMACIEGTSPPSATKAMPEDAPSIRTRLVTLSRDIASSKADLLELLVRFDDMEGWKCSGATRCVAWMNLELGIGIQLGWEYLRVGRKLRDLPTTTALFRAGKLSWSKVRLICRVANGKNEKTLCHAALDASVSELERLCAGYRWDACDDESGNKDCDRAVRQLEERSLHANTNRTSSGSTIVTLTLPPEQAQAFLKCVEHSLNQLEDDASSNIAQRRADAALLMAENSIQNAGRDIATADRYQVIVSVDQASLQNTSTDTTQRENSNTPTKCPTITGLTPIAQETARRIACDCCISTNTVANGETKTIGRKSRIWPAGISRAIRERDQHCQYPGCSHTNHLHIHHIKHWADGGDTSVANGVLLCSAHHQLVHEGGYSIERVDLNEQQRNEQFAQQQNHNDTTQFEFERLLRSDRESFDTVRRLSPSRFRFRVLDSEGKDVRSAHCKPADYTRVYCAEPTASYTVNTTQSPVSHSYPTCKSHRSPSGSGQILPA